MLFSRHYFPLVSGASHVIREIRYKHQRCFLSVDIRKIREIRVLKKIAGSRKISNTPGVSINEHESTE